MIVTLHAHIGIELSELTIDSKEIAESYKDPRSVNGYTLVKMQNGDSFWVAESEEQVQRLRLL